VRRFVYVLVALGLAWSLPRVRQHTWEPALVRLGPVGDWALGPSRNTGAHINADHLLRTLIADQKLGHVMPEPGRFPEWAAGRFGDPKTALDPWGTPFYLERSGRRLTVGSAGADRARGTPDDVRATGSI
jgi:hypothetical protein